MSVILFRLPPSVSHYNLCLKMAIELSKNHDVYFMGTHLNIINLVLKNYGLKYIYIQGVQDKNQHSTFKNFIIEKIHRHGALNPFTLYMTYNKSIDNIIDTLKPDLIMLDELLKDEGLFFVSRPNIKIHILSTQVRSVFRYNYPKKNSKLFPSNNLLNIVKLNTEWIKAALFSSATTLRILFALILFFEFRLCYRYILLLLHKPQSKIYLLPEEFEFSPLKKKKDEHYIGNQFLSKRIEFTEKGEPFQDDIVRLIKKNKRGKRLVYCSFGTTPMNQDNEYLNVLQELVLFFADQSNILLVISDQHFKHRQSFDNVLVFNRVPQLKILSLTDLTITHGGLGTILECIHFEVPMFALPLSNHRDQWGNSSRIIYHKLGLRGDFHKEAKSEIKKSITHMLLNLEKYKKAVIDFKNTIHPCPAISNIIK